MSLHNIKDIYCNFQPSEEHNTHAIMIIIPWRLYGLLFILSLRHQILASAATIYVDAILGNDHANDGRSLDKPFQTIPHAKLVVQNMLQSQQLSGTFEAIDVVLRGGTYVLR
jgi:hypothetical protein